MDREALGGLIYDSLKKNQSLLKEQFAKTKNKIGFFYLDNLLPEPIALEIYQSFPKPNTFASKKNLREYKFVGVNMDSYPLLLKEITYAFHSKKVVDLVAKICNTPQVLADKELYAGGLSMMQKDNFLNPHLDNSHNRSMQLYRVFNLLYYVTPNWKLSNGGNLELWHEGLNNKPTNITSKFNRLVVMATHKNSWHSVSKVKVDRARCCVSNYYFSKKPLDGLDSFHVTTFRARPENRAQDFILQADNFLRQGIRKILPKGIKKNKHYYKQGN